MSRQFLRGHSKGFRKQICTPFCPGFPCENSTDYGKPLEWRRLSCSLLRFRLNPNSFGKTQPRIPPGYNATHVTVFVDVAFSFSCSFNLPLHRYHLHWEMSIPIPQEKYPFVANRRFCIIKCQSFDILPLDLEFSTSKPYTRWVF